MREDGRGRRTITSSLVGLGRDVLDEAETLRKNRGKVRPLRDYVPSTEVLELVLQLNRLRNRYTVCDTSVRHEKAVSLARLTLRDLGSSEALLDNHIATYMPEKKSSAFARPPTLPPRANGKVHIPLGPNVTLTAFASVSTPVKIAALPSFENLISLCAPLVNLGDDRAAARRAARVM